ncbi:MAG: phosphatidylserine decarboxylase [Halieaceae bacterium]|jgi:phosphatidylserine decarboxylase
MLDKLFVLVQHVLPQHELSRWVGWLAETRITWLKDWLIAAFIKQYRVEMSEAANPNPRAYENFNSFFTRALAEGQRPLAGNDASLISPADGAISQIGNISQGRIFQAKGQYFSAAELLGGPPEQVSAYNNGRFATIYLSPRDYHRVHMPLAGTLTSMTYIPGQLFSVNTTTAEQVPRLFARNERLVCHFDTAAGPMALVMVGAMIVAAIETVWAGQVAPPPRTIVTTNYDPKNMAIELNRGDEMGRFKLGSTVILLFPEDSIQWSEDLVAGSPVRMGGALGSIS